MKCLLPLAVGCLLLSIGCSKTQQAADSESSQEIARLREENQDLEKLRADNQETQRLRKEAQDIHKLRGQYQELSRARKENEDLKKQMTKLGLPTDIAAPALIRAGSPALQVQTAAATAQPSQSSEEPAQEVVIDKDTPQEGDEIFVEPKFLAVLLPDIDWSKLNRAEPIGIKSLLEQQGIVLTNYQELVSRGITNYTVHRNYATTPAAQTEPQTQNPQ